MPTLQEKHLISKCAWSTVIPPLQNGLLSWSINLREDMLYLHMGKMCEQGRSEGLELQLDLEHKI